MPLKSLYNTSGSYDIKTERTKDAIEITLILNPTWAKQLGLTTNKFFARELSSDMPQQEHWLEEKLWTNIRELAQPIKVTDYYYPAETYQKH